jgi:D-3-phosphoglycerate dehydrogenase
LSEGRLAEIRLSFQGDIAALDCAPLTAATVQGVLAPMHDHVNMVNALPIAKTRGVRILESKSTEPTDFASLISVALFTDRGKSEVAGTLYGQRDPRLVQIDGFRVEAVLDGLLLIYSNMDVPGSSAGSAPCSGSMGSTSPACSSAGRNGAVAPWPS